MTNETGLRFLPRTMRSRVLVAAGAVLAIVAATVLRSAAGSRRVEAERLADILQVRDGIVVAEIGAGTGWLTVEVAQRIGPSGHIYATELNVPRLDDIREAASEAGLTNVTVLESGERSTRLPPGCCDAIFMRRVYHHFSDPSAMTTSIQQALKPGGRLAIIEFPPDGLVGTITRMGIGQPQLVDQVTATGFTLVSTQEWPGWDHYVALFQKARSK